MISEIDIIRNLQQELLDLGWVSSKGTIINHHNCVSFEVKINLGLRADCVLYINGKAVAIIEVRNDNFYPILHALEQAKKYALSYSVISPEAWTNPLPFIFAYNGKQILFRDLKDINSNPKEIKKFYSPDELKKMLYTIPYGPTNVTNNFDKFIKYLKFAIILISANSSNSAIQKYFESRFSEDKFYVIGKKEYGIKRVLQFAYYLFSEVYLLNPSKDIFGINNKLLEDIKDFSNKNIEMNLLKNSENLIDIPQGKRIIKDASGKIIVNFEEGFVRDVESYAIPIYEKFKNSGEQYIKFGVKNQEKENSNFIYKLVQKLNSDKPTVVDYLNREADAVRLASFIANKNTQTPFNLAIISSWGSGKSSFVNFMVNHLNAINNSFSWKKTLFSKNNFFDNKEYKKINIIKFNAWQYNNEQIGYALLDSIYSKLSFLSKILLKTKEILNIQNLLGIVFLLLAIYFLCHILHVRIVNRDNINIFIDALTLLIGGSIIAFAINTFKCITNTIGEFLSFKYTKIYKENIDIKYKIKDNICNYLKILNKNKKRTVIFIDDLDRCSEQSIISLLDTLIIYFADDCDIIVVLNIDISIILDAINSKLNKNTINETQAIKYLDKIIQANYNIPKILSNEYDNIISKLLPLSKLETNSSVMDKDVDFYSSNLIIEKEENLQQNKNNSQEVQPIVIQDLPVDIIEELNLFLQENGELLEYNPRKIKRIINILKLLINDLSDNSIEYNAKYLVANICLLEYHPKLSCYINKQFDNNSNLNVNDIKLDNLKSNSKFIDLLNKNLPLIDKNQYYYIRKYIYDLSTIITNS